MNCLPMLFFWLALWLISFFYENICTFDNKYYCIIRSEQMNEDITHDYIELFMLLEDNKWKKTWFSFVLWINGNSFSSYSTFPPINNRRTLDTNKVNIQIELLNEIAAMNSYHISISIIWTSDSFNAIKLNITEHWA